MERPGFKLQALKIKHTDESTGQWTLALVKCKKWQLATFFAHFRSFKTTIQFVLHLHVKIIHLVYAAEI